MNYCITAACHGGHQPLVLLRCSIAAFRSTALLRRVSLNFLWQYSRDSLWGPGQATLLTNQAQLLTLNKAFGMLDWYQVLLEDEISISTQLAGRTNHRVLWNFPLDDCIGCRLQKTQWTNTNRWHGIPTHHSLRKLHTELQKWLCTSPLFIQTLVPRFLNKIQNLLSSERRNLDLWATVLLYNSP